MSLYKYSKTLPYKISPEKITEQLEAVQGECRTLHSGLLKSLEPLIQAHGDAEDIVREGLVHKFESRFVTHLAAAGYVLPQGVSGGIHSLIDTLLTSVIERYCGNDTFGQYVRDMIPEDTTIVQLTYQQAGVIYLTDALRVLVSELRVVLWSYAWHLSSDILMLSACEEQAADMSEVSERIALVTRLLGRMDYTMSPGAIINDLPATVIDADTASTVTAIYESGRYRESILGLTKGDIIQKSGFFRCTPKVKAANESIRVTARDVMDRLALIFQQAVYEGEDANLDLVDEPNMKIKKALSILKSEKRKGSNKS